MKIKYFSRNYLEIVCPVSHKKCCSLGIHVDLKYRYTTIHLLWFTFIVGRRNFCYLTDEQWKQIDIIQKEAREKIKELHLSWNKEPLTV